MDAGSLRRKLELDDVKDAEIVLLLPKLHNSDWPKLAPLPRLMQAVERAESCSLEYSSADLELYRRETLEEYTFDPPQQRQGVFLQSSASLILC
jgi:hypothetical protein